MRTYCILLFSLLGACVSKNKLPDPSAEMTPPHWEFQTEYDADRNITFWINSFQADGLTDAALKAWKNNPDILSMAETVLASGEDAVILGANILPMAQANVVGSRSKRNLIGFNLPGEETSFTTNSFSSGVNVSWEIDLWGKLSNLRNSAEKSFEGTKADYEAARLSLAGKVAKAWFGIAESSAQLSILRKTTETYSKNQSLINNRFEKGLSNALETSLATSILANAQANFSEGRRIHQMNLRSLAILMGQYPSTEYETNMSGEIPQLTLPPPPPTPAELLSMRPDLRASRLKMKASGLNLRASEKNLFPSFSIVGGPGSRAAEFNDILDERFQTWDLSGSITQPIFQGGRLKAQTRKAKALRKAALEHYKGSILNAFAEVENALSAEALLTEEEASLQLAVKASASAARISWERYQRGVENIFNALESQNRAFGAESRLLSVRRKRIHNRIDLYLAIGLPALPYQR